MKKNKIVIDLVNSRNLEEVYLNSAIRKINNGALTEEEADALIERASREGANKLLRSMFYPNNAVVLETDEDGNCEIVQLFASLVSNNGTVKSEELPKKKNIFKRIWNKIFKK